MSSSRGHVSMYKHSHTTYVEDFAECSFHHCRVPNTSPAAFNRRPCTGLDSLEIKGATNHSGPLITTDFWLLWAVAKGVISCRWTKTPIAPVAMAFNRGPVSWEDSRKKLIHLVRGALRLGYVENMHSNKKETPQSPEIATGIQFSLRGIAIANHM